MSKIAKSFMIMLVLLMSLLVPSVVKADTSNDSSISCKLTIISPDNNTAYVGTMSLSFTMYWTANTAVPFMWVNMSYGIDDGQKISIADGNSPSFNSTAQGTFYHFEYVIDFPTSSTVGVTNTLTDIDVSSLAGGAHKLTVFADGEFNSDNDFIFPYHYQSSPIYFSVNYLGTYPTASPSPTPSLSPTESSTLSDYTPVPTMPSSATPTVPELPASAILPLLLFVFAVAIIVRHRKVTHG